MSDDSSSSDGNDSMPGLVLRQVAVPPPARNLAAAAAGQALVFVTDGTDVWFHEPAAAGRAESDDDDDGSSDFDDDDGSLPPLAPRFPHVESPTSSDDDDDSMPELVGRHEPAALYDSSDDDDNSIPELIARRNADYDSSSDDDDDSMPELIGRDHDAYDSSSDDGDSVPPLLARGDDADDSSSSSSTDSSMPELIPRRDRPTPPPGPGPPSPPLQLPQGNAFRSGTTRPPARPHVDIDVGGMMMSELFRDRNDGDDLSNLFAGLLGMGVDLFGGRGGGGYGTDREDGWSDGGARDDASLDGFLRAEHTVTVIEQGEDGANQTRGNDDNGDGEEEEEEDSKPAAAAVGQVLPRVEGEPEKYDDETRTFENNESLGLYNPFSSMYYSMGSAVPGVQRSAARDPSAQRGLTPQAAMLDLLMGPQRNRNSNFDDAFDNFDRPPLVERDSNNNGGSGSDTDPEMPALLGFSANSNTHQARGPRGARGGTRYPDDTEIERIARRTRDDNRRRAQLMRQARSRERVEARRGRLSVQQLEESRRQLEEDRRRLLRDEEERDQNRSVGLASTNNPSPVPEPDASQQFQLADAEENRELAERFWRAQRENHEIADRLDRAQRAVAEIEQQRAEIERQRAERGEGELGAFVTMAAYSYGTDNSSDHDYDDSDSDGNESDSTASSMPPLIHCHNGEVVAADNGEDAEFEAVD